MLGFPLSIPKRKLCIALCKIATALRVNQQSNFLLYICKNQIKLVIQSFFNIVTNGVITPPASGTILV